MIGRLCFAFMLQNLIEGWLQLIKFSKQTTIDASHRLFLSAAIAASICVPTKTSCVRTS